MNGASILAIMIWLTAMESVIAADPVDFVGDVRPILAEHCYACHGEDKQKSGLRLDIKSTALGGGDGHGPSIIPGDADDSPLIQLITSDDEDSRMPPVGERLSQADIATLSRWIDEGAVWPDGVDLATLEDRTDHWSFKPLAFSLPVSDPIDAFVSTKLAEHGMEMSPPADRVTWLRRVTFDLTGLPPTPDQIEDFCEDQRFDAYQRVVDRLLASPRYGERWAQHWLDVVRYADTDGFEVNTPRANAWPYRDYVIDAFNNDTPYDQFIRDQLAGDTTGQDAATGFLVTAAALLPGQIGQDDASKRLARQDALAEIIHNTADTFLALSVGCARCHDHKFDAISQQDYYSMQAFFSGVQYGERPLRSAESDATRQLVESLGARVAEIDRSIAAIWDETGTGPTNPHRNEYRFAPVDAKFVRFTIHHANTHPSLGLIEPCIDEFEIFTSGSADENVALSTVGTTVTASGSRVSDAHRLEHINDGLYGNSRSWMSDKAGGGWVLFALPSQSPVDRVVWSRDREGRFDDRLATLFTLEVGPSLDEMHHVAGVRADDLARLESLIDQRDSLAARIAEADQVPMVFAGNFTVPEPTHLLYRGDPEQPREEVVPAIPAVFGTVALGTDSPEQVRRQTLAAWIASPENPLTARVMVNRVWQWHFGVGLVETASDFGRSGARPTHPELLDYLANEFIRSGWSIKHMHRLIVLSETYRQSAGIDHHAQSRDADVRLLWRFPSRRLEAEAIRDTMLDVSGELVRTMGGPGFDLFQSRGGLSGFPPIESFGGDGLRRMIYAHKIRMERDAVFGAFDCPDAGQSTARRGESTTPIQALNLFNSQFTIDRANAFASRVRAESGDDLTAQISRAYYLALGRRPGPDEIATAEPAVRQHGLATLCRVLFNSNEFLFIP